MSRVQILLGNQALYDTAWLSSGAMPLPAIRAEISGIGGKGWDWVVEVVQPIRASQIGTIDRALSSTDLKFTVSTQYPSHADALLALMTGPLKIVRGGQVHIVATDDGGTVSKFYLTNGQLQSIGQPSIIGVKIFQTYSLIGGQWTTTLPAS